MSSYVTTETLSEKYVTEELWIEYIQQDRPDNIHLRLVEHYLPLVIKIAKNIKISDNAQLEFEDFVSIGVIGLHKALRSFTPDRDVSFQTFAYKRVKGAIFDELRKLDNLTRTQRGYYKTICNAINELAAELSRPPSDNEIAERTGLSISVIDYYIGLGSAKIQLDEEFDKGITFGEIIPDNKTIAPDTATHNILALEELKYHYYNLSEREQKILFLRHFQELSVREIAAVLNISEGRISQIYKKIILKLRALMQ